MNTDHKQVLINKNKDIYCDKGLSDIIYCLNKHGFNTLNSCQRGEIDGNVYIMFSDLMVLQNLILYCHKRSDINYGLIRFLFNGNKWDFMVDENITLQPTIRFPANKLPHFKKLFFKIFNKPKVKFKGV